MIRVDLWSYAALLLAFFGLLVSGLMATKVCEHLRRLTLFRPFFGCWGVSWGAKWLSVMRARFLSGGGGARVCGWHNTRETFVQREVRLRVRADACLFVCVWKRECSTRA